MTDELEPAPAEGPQGEEPSWSDQYAPKPAVDAAPFVPSAVAVPSVPPRTRSLGLAFLAAAGAALAGGLAWAGIAVATGYYFGFVAFFIGVATGITARAVHGAPIGGFERALAGVFAAGAVILGNYVIFVHEVRAQFHASVGYLDTDQMRFFVQHLGSIIHGFDWLWVALAAFAAVRSTSETRRKS